MVMDAFFTIPPVISSKRSVIHLILFFTYLAIAGSVLPGKVVLGAPLPDGTRVRYRCNGLISLILLVALLGLGLRTNLVSPEDICGRGIELLSASLALSLFTSLVLYVFGYSSIGHDSSEKSYPSRNFVHDWWFGVQLNPQFMGLDMKFFFVRAGMMGWLIINLSILAKSIQDSTLTHSMVLYQTFSMVGYNCGKVGIHACFWRFSLDSIRFQYSVLILLLLKYLWKNTHKIGFKRQGERKKAKGWWLLGRKVDLTPGASSSICAVFIAGYLIFRGANRQKHVFKRNPKALIWGKPPQVIGGTLLASGYWGMARHCNYLGDLLLALSFSLPCGTSSLVPYSYPVYLVILLVWRERRDEARCAAKYKALWDEYTAAVPWRILPLVY